MKTFIAALLLAADDCSTKGQVWMNQIVLLCLLAFWFSATWHKMRKP